MNPKALVLLSGGLDSTTTLAIAKEEHFQLFTLSFDYGQRHRVELDRAQEISRQAGVVEHKVIEIDLRQLGGSALTDSMEVPAHRTENEIASGIPVTYVPARNTIFLALALAYAEVKDIQDLFLGVNAVDYSGYPDCRPEFIEAFEALARLATKMGVEGKQKFKVHTPLIHLTKAQIIQKGMALGVDYSRTHSCYAPGENGLACGVCDSCQLRIKGFREAKQTDPVAYQKPQGH